MSTPTTQIVRPAGAGHETLNVLLLCLLILAVAGSVVAWRGVSHEPEPVASNQFDARRDLSASEQGIYADLRVTLDEIRLLREEQQALPTPQNLADEGFRAVCPGCEFGQPWRSCLAVAGGHRLFRP
jgi:hypothetical protein